ncbi:MAG TPA: hypothetical protein PLF42_14185 [Anaerolineales bacterium]|nr:hypothetical protein [Anaerolineales bacterium]
MTGTFVTALRNARKVEAGWMFVMRRGMKMPIAGMGILSGGL